MDSEKECLRPEAGRFLAEEGGRARRSLLYEKTPRLWQSRENQEKF